MRPGVGGEWLPTWLLTAHSLVGVDHRAQARARLPGHYEESGSRAPDLPRASSDRRLGAADEQADHVDLRMQIGWLWVCPVRQQAVPGTPAAAAVPPIDRLTAIGPGPAPELPGSPAQPAGVATLAGRVCRRGRLHVHRARPVWRCGAAMRRAVTVTRISSSAGPWRGSCQRY